MRTPLRVLIARRIDALKASPPKSRDRIRHRLNTLLMLRKLKREIREDRKAA